MLMLASPMQLWNQVFQWNYIHYIRFLHQDILRKTHLKDCWLLLPPSQLKKQAKTWLLDNTEKRCLYFKTGLKTKRYGSVLNLC